MRNMLQIIRWLLTGGQKVNKENIQRSKALVTEAKSRDVVPFNRDCAPALPQDYEENSKEENCNKSLGLLLGGGVDNSTALFYGTLKHRILGLKPDFINTAVGHNMAATCQVDRDVLSLCASMSCTNGVNRGINGGPKSRLFRGGGGKGRALSKMKELLRWEAASNPDWEGGKRWKVLYFRNRGALGSGRYDTEPPNSSILSIKHEAGSSRSTFAAISEHNKANSISACIVKEPVKRGSWITTDSDFVVLEL